MSEHYFTCPKCGGHHFGRDTADGGVMLATVQCHSASDGQPILALDEWVAAGKPKQTWCKWRGEWPAPPDTPRDVRCFLADGSSVIGFYWAVETLWYAKDGGKRRKDAIKVVGWSELITTPPTPVDSAKSPC